MADEKTLLVAGGTGMPKYVPQTLKDVGDTTYAPVMYVNNFPVTQAVTISGSGTANVSSVATTAASSTVLPANANRKGAKFFSATGTILLKYGTNASATSFTERLVTNGTHELPGPTVYTGVVSAIGAGTLSVTEW